MAIGGLSLYRYNSSSLFFNLFWPYFLRVVELQVVSSMWAPTFARLVPIGVTPVRVWPICAWTGLIPEVSRALECEGSVVERIYICDGEVAIWKNFFVFVTKEM